MYLLKNAQTELVFDMDGSLRSLRYNGKEYIGATLPLFQIAFRDRDGVQTRLTATEMRAICTLQKNYLEFSFTSENLHVIASVSLSEESELSWNLRIDGEYQEAVEWVDFPQIAVKDDFADHDGNTKALWGFNEGTLIENMEDREAMVPYFEPEYPCRGIMGVFPAIVETQFMAYYDEVSGLYFASHDAENHLKGINLYRKNGGVKLEYRHFTGGDFGEAYEMPYPMVMRFFHGDWHDACEIYRTWFQSLQKEEFIPIPQNQNLPAWYGESPVVITYPVRGTHDTDTMNPNKLFPYTNILPHVERFEKVFQSKIMVLLMHWEGTAPWAPPIVWPPYGGEDALRALIDELHKRGDILGVYTSGIGWTLKSNLVDVYSTESYFEEHHLEKEMCLSPAQDLPYSEICTAQRSGYDMCPTREFTERIVKEQVAQMTEAGIDYIQLLDQNHGGTSYFCYSQAHDHPPMPGKWQVDAMKHLLSEVNENNRGVLFGCESAAAESYIPNLLFSDNRFNLAYYLGKPVPAYAYIYHEYLNNFQGNQVCVDWNVDPVRSPESFFERIAYSFCAGDMLTAVITENGEIDWNWGKRHKDIALPDQKNAETLICNLNYWRQQDGKKYLHSGKMIKPEPIRCNTQTIYRTNGTAIKLPSVHTCAWETTEGKRAQFFVNYGKNTEKFTVSLPFSGILTEKNGTKISLASGKHEISVPPFSALMLEKN